MPGTFSPLLTGEHSGTSVASTMASPRASRTFSPLLTGEHSGTHPAAPCSVAGACLSVPYLPGNTVERPLLVAHPGERRAFSPLLTGEHSGTTFRPLAIWMLTRSFSPLLTGEHSGTPGGPSGLPGAADPFQSPTYRGTQWNLTSSGFTTLPSSSSFSPLLTGEHSGTRPPATACRRSTSLSVPYLPGNTVERSRRRAPLYSRTRSFQSPTYRGTQWNIDLNGHGEPELVLSVPYLPGNTVERARPVTLSSRRSTPFSPLLTGEHSGT